MSDFNKICELQRIKEETKKLFNHVKTQAKEYRKEWQEDLTVSEDIEEYGLNEFLGGKAEVYEDIAELLKKILINK